MVHKLGEPIATTGKAGGEARAGPAGPPPGRAQTHFADSVLMEPVTSMSPARNSWYLVQAMVADKATHQSEQLPPGHPGVSGLSASGPAVT